jgi:hypothetical protein
LSFTRAGIPYPILRGLLSAAHEKILKKMCACSLDGSARWNSFRARNEAKRSEAEAK